MMRATRRLAALRCRGSSQVVEVPLDGADRAGVRINLEPLLTVIGLVRKV